MLRRRISKITTSSLILFYLFFQIEQSLFAQITADENVFLQNLVDQLIQEDEDLDGSSINDLYEELSYRLKDKININKIEREFFEITRLLDDAQINAFFKHKETYGDFIALEELQAVDGLDANSIQTILPFLKLSGSTDYQVSIPKMLKSGSSTLYLKWQSVLQDQAGYDPDRENGYLGSQDKLTLRYRYSYENRLKLGLIAEKDAGEEFFRGTNRNGFDYYSAYAHLRDFRSWLKDFIIGDYTVSIGQGIVMHNNFGAGKGSFVNNIKKGGRTIRSYESLAENNFFRGAAATFVLGKSFELSAFGSHADKDGNSQVDTLENEAFFNGILEAGNHRTLSELDRKDSVNETIGGAYLTYKNSALKLSAYSTYFRYELPIRRQDFLRNKFRFADDQVLYNGLDYSYRIRNFNFFGEVSNAANSTAFLQGALIAVNPNISLSFLYRDYPRDFPSIRSNAFGESSEANNESGFYSGLSIRFNNRWSFSSYVDVWKFPWLRFQVDLPSTGYEYFAKLDYFVKRKLYAYVQYRHEKKQENFSIDGENITEVLDRFRDYLRVHINYNLNKNLELRNRVEFSFFRHGTQNDRGFLAYQDIIYRPVGKRFSFTARYAIFDTDGFDSRIFAYENDLLYEFFIPSFSNRGSRFYINMRYNLTYNLLIEGRYERTFIDNQEGFSSGLEFIEGQERERLKFQLKWKF